MASTDQDFTVPFLYGNLRVEIINCLNEYIDNDEVDRLEELKDRFSECLPEEERRRVRSVKQLVDALERQGVIGQNNVKIIKLLAGRIGLQALVEKIEEYEYDCSGFITKIFKGVAGAVKTSAIQVKAVLSSREVQATALAAAIVMTYGASPETLQKLKTFKDVRAELLELRKGSVVFVLKVSSIASIKRLWKGYKDGSLKKSMKKDLNEMKELKELSKGEEIDVELTIDEEEYQEVYWNLIISEVKANDARQNDEKQPTLSRRHSIGCEQDVPKSSNLPGVSYLHIQAWRHIDELNKVLYNFKSIKAKKETSEDTAIALKEVISMVEQEKKRLSEIRQELSDLNIEIGFEKVKVEEKAELTVIQEKVKSTDLGGSTSFQAEEVEKQSDQSTQVPHPDQMTYDEKLLDADVRKAGEKLEEKESFTQSVVAMLDKERMSKTQQLLLRERFSLFKDDIIPTELLDNLPCLTNEQKDQIAYDEKNHLPSKAVETLVEKLKEHKEGFEQFVEALRKADLGHVAALLDANYFDIPIIVRIKGQIKLEREIASKFSNSSSKEAKKLRQDFEKMPPRGIYFVHTKLMEDVSAKNEGTKTPGAEDVPQSTEDSLAVVFRVNKINLLEKLWQMYRDRRLDAVFRSVWAKELGSSLFELFFREEDYTECKRILKEDVKAQSTPLDLQSSTSGFEKVKVEEKAELTVIQEKVKSTDLGPSTSFQVEEAEKQSDQSTQVPHPDQMTYDEKLSDAYVRKAGEKLEEKESFTQSAVAMRVKERMSETQQLLLEKRFPFFKDDIIPTELLDNLPCLTNEQKDQIAYDEKNHLPSKAVETLVEKLKEHKEGFGQFVEALRKADLGHVAALLDANYFDIPIIVRIRGQRKLEIEIASKFSNSSSKEAKKLRQDFEKWEPKYMQKEPKYIMQKEPKYIMQREPKYIMQREPKYMQREPSFLNKMLPRGIYFVRTKLMEDVSAKDEVTKRKGAQDVTQSTEDSLAVVFRVNKINLLEKLREMHILRELEEVIRSVLWNELSSSAVDLFFRKEDYDECKRTLKEVNWKAFIEENPAAFKDFIGKLDRGSATYVFAKCSVLADRLGAPSPIKEKCKSSSMKKQSPTLALLEFLKVCGNLSVNGLVEKLIIMGRYDVIYTIESGIPDYQEYPLKNALRDHKEVFQQVARQLDEAVTQNNWRNLGCKLGIEVSELDQIALGCNPAKQLLEDYAYPTLEPEKLTVGCFRQHIKTMDRDDILRLLENFGITQQDDARSIKDVIPPDSERMWKMSVPLNKYVRGLKDWRSLAQLWGIKHEVYSQFNPLQENPFKILLQDWLTVERPEFTVNDLCAILKELQMNDANTQLEKLF